MSYSARQNAQFKSPKKANHIVHGGHGYRPPLRKAIKRCKKCADIPERRPENGGQCDGCGLRADEGVRVT